MLGDGDDVGLAMGEDEGAGERGDGVGIGAEASVALRRSPDCSGIEIEIDHRAEIEVEAGIGQLLGHRRIERSALSGVA